MNSFKSKENIHKKEDRSYYVVSANKASSDIVMTRQRKPEETFNFCGLSANLYIHWLRTQAMIYELLYFDKFEGADKRVWQLLKDLDFKNDKKCLYVTIESNALICHFYQDTPVRPSVRSFIHPSIFAGYEMTKMGTKWLCYELTSYSHFVPSWPRYEMTKMGTKWPLGTKWLLLGTKWPKSRYEMIWVRNDLQPW